MVETFDCSKVNIKQGARGSQVTLLQTHLQTLGYYLKAPDGSKLVVDGKYEKYTIAAVKEFQRKTGHSDDGWFGPKTCSSLNEKILAHYNIKTTPASTTTTTKTTASTTSTSANTYLNKYKVNTQNNVISSNNANITIQGLYFRIGNLKRSVELNSPEVKTIELMDGSDYDYLSSEKALQYTFDTYLSRSEYSKIRPELNKLGYQVCNVSTSLFPSTTYWVKVTPDESSVDEIKISFEIKQKR